MVEPDGDMERLFIVLTGEDSEGQGCRGGVCQKEAARVTCRHSRRGRRCRMCAFMAGNRTANFF